MARVCVLGQTDSPTGTCLILATERNILVDILPRTSPCTLRVCLIHLCAQRCDQTTTSAGHTPLRHTGYEVFFIYFFFTAAGISHRSDSLKNSLGWSMDPSFTSEDGFRRVYDSSSTVYSSLLLQFTVYIDLSTICSSTVGNNYIGESRIFHPSHIPAPPFPLSSRSPASPHNSSGHVGLHKPPTGLCSAVLSVWIESTKKTLFRTTRWRKRGHHRLPAQLCNWILAIQSCQATLTFYFTTQLRAPHFESWLP